jgi:hypothetical protein
VRIPIWLTLGIALLVIAFGSYRIWLATRPKREDGEQPRSLLGGGFYRMSPRAHLAIGVIYLLLGASLVATSFGWNPFGGLFGPKTEEPSKDNAPVKPGSVPTDQLPKK